MGSREHFPKSALAGFLSLVMIMLACSSVDDIIGQRPPNPTPTAPIFSTATPGGRISVSLLTPAGDTVNSNATSIGQIVAPAATATAAYATVQAATAIAQIPLNAPRYVPAECPQQGGPPPPQQPTSFSEYPVVIGQYLSAGGPSTILEAILRSWKVINVGAVIQSDTDLTGDGVPEVIVNIFDPTYYQADRISPGQLLVYGCADGGYRLLFSTAYSPQTAIPELRRVGDMNGDVLPELAYSQRLCYAGLRCTQSMQILDWNTQLEVFKPLNVTPIEASNGRIAIADPDNDGNWEVLIVQEKSKDPLAGPPRRSVTIWDWDGQAYRFAILEIERPVYYIHLIHDGDYWFDLKEWRLAIRNYDRVRTDTTLQSWPLIPNEIMLLRSYATYKKMLAQVGGGNRGGANETLATLVAENPVGTPGQAYVLVGQAFMDNFNRTRNRQKACTAALSIAQVRPDSLTYLNSYGYNNRAYTIRDLCSF